MVEKLPPRITLKAARINAGLTAKEVANKVHKHYQTILAYEKDSGNIPNNLLTELSEIYKYPMDYIFLGKTYCLNSTKDKAS
ncbi:helix-turn-helix transcriptional regulator [Lactococcus formosensis]|uniref:helix-turn-helix transcriptional regulator n=1 Tax=Lactococcus formosensis TaxID=1281486 RepID=UPI00288ECB0B|nr:helix-turn-helix transcriptional regulator [Lactococcus formosensis]MDT2726531.1 helix-turn-helix transcriptional regulator [Lactococcus formosensis]